MDKCVELLRQFDAVTFERQEREDICARRRDLMPPDYNAVKLLTDLFGFSVIGYYQAGRTGYGGAQYIFRYKQPRAMFNPNALSYQVHLGLLET